MLQLKTATPGRNTLRIACLALPLLSSGATRAGEPLTAGPDCGGDAFSSAQVIEHRPPRRGPLTAMPDTLCTDLTPQQRRQVGPAGLALRSVRPHDNVGDRHGRGQGLGRAGMDFVVQQRALRVQCGKGGVVHRRGGCGAR